MPANQHNNLILDIISGRYINLFLLYTGTDWVHFSALLQYVSKVQYKNFFNVNIICGKWEDVHVVIVGQVVMGSQKI